MSFDVHSLEAYSTVLTAPSPATSGTTLVLQSGDGAKFGYPQNATVWPAGTSIPTKANSEIVRITGISTDTLTITRAQEGSLAISITAGMQIANTITPKVLTDIEAQALGGTVTRTSTDTLTNKTLQTNLATVQTLNGNPVWQYLGYSQVTTSDTVASATFAAFSTNLAVTFTVPTGCSQVKITVAGSFAGTTTGDGYSIGVFDGVTLLGGITWSQSVGGYFVPISTTIMVSVPSAGSHTYTLKGAGAGATTLTMEATAGSALSAFPPFILVECC